MNLDCPFLLLGSVETIASSFVNAMTFASILLWIYAATCWFSGKPFLRDRNPKEVSWSLTDLLVIMALWFCSGLAAISVASWISESKPITMLVQSSAILLATIAGISFVRMRFGKNAFTGISLSTILVDLKIGLVGFVMLFPPVIWLQGYLNYLLNFTYEHTTLEMVKEDSSGFVLFATFFSAVIVAPIVEEVFFRMFLQGWLQRLRWPDTTEHRFHVFYGSQLQSSPNGEIPFADNTNSKVHDKESTLISPRRHILAILAGAAIFASIHITPQSGAAPIALFVFAIGLGYIYQRTGSVIPCIVVHFLLNCYSMTVQTFFSAS